MNFRYEFLILILTEEKQISTSGKHEYVLVCWYSAKIALNITHCQVCYMIQWHYTNTLLNDVPVCCFVLFWGQDDKLRLPL